MTIITHCWKETQINQTSGDTEIARYTVPTGYVNVSKMCQHHNKLWADYKRMNGSTAYLEALSLDMGITTSNLIIEIKGTPNGDASLQGTWVHPEIAIDVAAWINVEFKVWANRTLRKVITGKPLEPQEVTKRFLTGREFADECIADKPVTPSPKYSRDFAREANRVWHGKDSDRFQGLQHFINKFIYDRYPWEARFKIDFNREVHKCTNTKHSYFRDGIPSDLLEDALGKITCLLGQCESGNRTKFYKIYADAMSDENFWKVEKGQIEKVS